TPRRRRRSRACRARCRARRRAEPRSPPPGPAACPGRTPLRARRGGAIGGGRRERTAGPRRAACGGDRARARERALLARRRPGAPSASPGPLEDLVGAPAPEPLQIEGDVDVSDLAEALHDRLVSPRLPEQRHLVGRELQPREPLVMADAELTEPEALEKRLG